MSQTNRPRTGAVPVFFYHRIGPLAANDTSRRLTVTPERFGFQMWLMAKLGYSTITMDQLCSSLSEGKLPDRKFVISFDDGFADLYDFALPILERWHFSAIVYLVTDRIGQTNGWDDGLGFPLQPLLDWDHVRSMQARGIEFGSHTATHARLTNFDDRALRDELARSRDTIAEHLNAPPRHFCYPYGACDNRVAEAVQAAGYASAVTTHKGRVRQGCQPLLLPRVKISKGTGNLRFCFNLAVKY